MGLTPWKEDPGVVGQNDLHPRNGAILTRDTTLHCPSRPWIKLEDQAGDEWTLDDVTRLVLTSTNCPKHTRLGETGRTWAKLEISAKVGDLDYDCAYER